jgi:hypothetical protein
VRSLPRITERLETLAIILILLVFGPHRDRGPAKGFGLLGGRMFPTPHDNCTAIQSGTRIQLILSKNAIKSAVEVSAF